MEEGRMFNLYNAVRRIFLYNRVGLQLTPEQIADELTKRNPGSPVAPYDVLEALGYGTICSDRREFDIIIRYRNPCSRKNPAATFAFDGHSLKLSTLKRVGKFERRYGDIMLSLPDGSGQRDEDG